MAAVLDIVLDNQDFDFIGGADTMAMIVLDAGTSAKVQMFTKAV